MTQSMTGGCLCGRIRYSARIDGSDAALCHCRMCRHSSGAFAAAVVQARPAAVSWEREPDSYKSSPIAERLFCRECGSPLGWRPLDGETMDLTLGSFDDPTGFVPVAHGGVESMIEVWLDTSDLPRYRTAEVPSMVERWRAVGCDVPD